MSNLAKSAIMDIVLFVVSMALLGLSLYFLCIFKEGWGLLTSGLSLLCLGAICAGVSDMIFGETDVKKED